MVDHEKSDRKSTSILLAPCSSRKRLAALISAHGKSHAGLAPFDMLTRIIVFSKHTL